MWVFSLFGLIPAVLMVGGLSRCRERKHLAELHGGAAFTFRLQSWEETKRPAAASDSISMTSSLLSVPTADRAKRSAHLEVNEIIEAQRNVTLRI